MRFFYIFLISIFCAFPFTTAAQSNLSDGPYTSQVRLALSEKPARFDFMQLRILYAQTSHYDPLGDETLGAMNDYAYIVLNDPDQEKVKTALFVYQALVSNHLAHVGVVMQALSLARQDKRFGKPEFFEWVRDGLVRTVVISGDGYTLRGAYDVITLPEEGLLFSRLGFERLQTQEAQEGATYYSVHDVLTSETCLLYTSDAADE